MRFEQAESALLVALVKEGLERDLIPSLSGEPKYVGRMAASALGIALRRLSDQGATGRTIADILRSAIGLPPTEADSRDLPRVLSDAIRAGAYDQPGRYDILLAHLRQINELDLSVSRGVPPQGKARAS